MKDKLLFIDDTPGLNPQEMRARIKRIARGQGNPGLIMVDYLQLMQIAGSSEGRTQEISEISRGLKELAKELECPIIALSQLNRASASRTDRRPQLQDLRESGAIEQDADIVMFLYRDDYYNPDTDEPNTTEVIISKQRNGPVGTIKLVWQGEYQRFLNKSMFTEVDEPMPWV